MSATWAFMLLGVALIALGIASARWAASDLDAPAKSRREYWLRVVGVACFMGAFWCFALPIIN